MKKKDFFLNILYSVLPMVLIIPLSIWGLSQMSKASYDCFFVIGKSMQPTLVGEVTDSMYGYYDSSVNAINNIQRFDLVVCYYPFSSHTDYEMPYQRYSEKTDEAVLKVKRIIGLPHDKLIISNDIFTVIHTVNGQEVPETYGPGQLELPFERLGPISNRICQINLGDEEYFVMGDNWTSDGSSDCCNPSKGSNVKPLPIYKENIAGVIFKIEGVCSYGYEECKVCKKQYLQKTSICTCGNTTFNEVRKNDILEKRPYDKPIYLK